MMLANADEIDANLVGENRFVQDVTNDVGVRQQLAVCVDGNVAECIDAEFDRFAHIGLCPREIRRGAIFSCRGSVGVLDA
jgi:hypothetical protein